MWGNREHQRRVFHVHNIEWDTDGGDVSLPECVYNIREEVLNKAFRHECPEEIFDLIIDFLSNDYGWCIKNCQIESTIISDYDNDERW